MGVAWEGSHLMCFPTATVSGKCLQALGMYVCRYQLMCLVMSLVFNLVAILIAFILKKGLQFLLQNRAILNFLVFS